MTSKPFDMVEHLEPLCRWMFLRGVKVPARHEIPATGLVVSHNNQLITMGFLRKVEGDMGIWDGLVSNPEASSAVRHEALDFAITELIGIAKELKMKSIFCWCADDNTHKRALKHEFKPSQFPGILTLELKNEDI